MQNDYSRARVAFFLDFYWQKDMDTMSVTSYLTQIAQGAFSQLPISRLVYTSLGQIC
jgi:hypothetical protein